MTFVLDLDVEQLRILQDIAALQGDTPENVLNVLANENIELCHGDGEELRQEWHKPTCAQAGARMTVTLNAEHARMLRELSGDQDFLERQLWQSLYGEHHAMLAQEMERHALFQWNGARYLWVTNEMVKEYWPHELARRAQYPVPYRAIVPVPDAVPVPGRAGPSNAVP